MSGDYNVFANFDNFLADDSNEDIPSRLEENGEEIVQAVPNELPLGDLHFSPIVTKTSKSKSRGRVKESSASDECLSDDTTSEAQPKSVDKEIGVSTNLKRSRRQLKHNDNTPCVSKLSPPRRTTRNSLRTSIAPPEVIDISDNEDAVVDPAINASFDEENAVIMIKVNWESKIQKIPLRKHQQFKYLCEKLAEQNGLDATKIVLTMNEKLIHHSETPALVKYNIAKFIYARIMETAVVYSRQTKTIELKVQSAMWKRPMMVRIEPTQKMKVLVILCAEELKCAPSKLRFNFDGDFLDLDATPEDLDLEGGEVLDLRMI